jgi:hypothetical protein
VGLSDLFQWRWYIRQVPLHGRSEDICTLGLGEVGAMLDELSLPPDLYRLWKTFLERRAYDQRTAQEAISD